MCAILGTSNLNKFEVLYEANLPRGNFATGVMCLAGKNEQQTIKKQGTIDFNEIKLDESCNFYIGHVQAPTSAKRSWAYDTSHPFESLSWSVFHNGVLTNHREIKEKYIPWCENPVDTAVIPGLLQYFTEKCHDECPGHDIISEVLGLLEGTFAVCVVDTDNNEVYIARQGSILHINDLGEFSTLKGKGFESISEGSVYTLKDYNSWHEVNKFKTRSPFVFL